MPDEEYGSEDDGSVSGAGASGLQILAGLGQQYTSPEAHRLARELYDETKTERQSIGVEEDEVAAQLEQTAKEARAQLAAAREKMLAQKYDKSEKWLSAAAALGKPTATGGWGETMGNLAASQLAPNQHRREFESNQDATDLEMQQGMTNIDRVLAQSRLAAAQARRTANAKLTAEAAKILSREVRPTPGANKGQMSKYGKIAADLGLVPGTAEFAAKVEQLRAMDATNAAATSGTDAPTNVDPQAAQDTAYHFGVPLSFMDPYAKLSTKQKTAAMALDQKDVEKRLGDLAAVTTDAQMGIQKIDRFIELNRRTETGVAHGLLPGISAAEQEMDGITAETSRKMRTPGEGSTSDYDAKMFKQGTVSRSKNRKANLNMGTAYKLMRKNEIDRVAFLQGYAAVNGHLRGADGAWKEYLEANPIFDPKKAGKFIMNPNRLDFQTYFRHRMGDTPALDDADVTPEEDTAVEPGHYEGDDIPAVAAPAHLAEGGAVRADPEVDFVEDQDDEDGKNHLREALYAALQGASGGMADEARGMVDPEGAASDRAEYSDYGDENPTERALALIAGLLPAAALVAPGGSTLTQLVGAGAGSGALFGATGADEDRGVAALQGAGMGAVAGPAAGLTAKYLYGKAGQLLDSSRGQGLTPGEEKVVHSANRDKVDLGQVATDLRASDRLRVPEGVQDRAGRRTQGLIERAATRGGDEADIYLRDQSTKNEGAYSRVEDQLNRGLAPSEYFGEAEKLKDALYTNAKPLYEAVYKKHPGIRSKVFNEIAGTKDGKTAIAEAFRLMENDQKPIGKAGPGGMVQKPSLEFLDYVKRGFDQMINTEEKGGATPLGHSLRSVRNRLRDELDAAAPDYKAARAQYAGDLEVRDALKSGREEFSKLAPEEVRRKIKGMSFAEKDAFRSGVYQHLQDALGRPTTDFNAARRIIGSEATKAKLAAIFDSPQKWKVFEAALNKEAEMFDNTKRSTARVEGQKMQEAKKGESVLSHLDAGMANYPGMGGISMWNRVYNWLRFPMPMSEATADSVIKTIKRGDVKAFDATMTRLAQAQKRLKVRGKRGSKVGAIAAIAAGALTQPTPPGEAATDEAR